MSILVVVNPVAGHGAGLHNIPMIKESLNKLDIEHDIAITTAPKDAIHISRKAVEEGYKIIAAVGGDGTVHEIVNGIYGTDVALAMIPVGSGNDYAIANNIPRDIKRACEIIKQDNRISVDVGDINGEKYVCIGGSGFDSEVNELANTRTPLLRGPAKYLYSVYKTLIHFKAANFRITCNSSTIDIKAMMVAVANASQYGGGMKVCPDAKITDGLFDIFVVKEISKLHFIKVFPRTYKGTHVTDPCIWIFRTDEVSLEADRDFAVYADGEYICRLPARFKLTPQSLKIVVPYSTCSSQTT
jgi:YegS/Rv2252/BmrU family lipid kinase